MNNKYIRDPNSLAVLESNLDALQQSRIRKRILKEKNNKIQELELQIKDLETGFNNLTELVNGIIKNGITSK